MPNLKKKQDTLYVLSVGIQPEKIKGYFYITVGSVYEALLIKDKLGIEINTIEIVDNNIMEDMNRNLCTYRDLNKFKNILLNSVKTENIIKRKGISIIKL
jgi:hypothetical protein